MAFKLDRLSAFFALVKADRTATKDFITLWEKLCRKLEAAIDTINTSAETQAAQQAQIVSILTSLGYVISATGVAQATANDAQAAADAAGGGAARSSSTTVTGIILSGTSWVPGGSVSLSTVSAGNLTITGSGPTGGNTSGTMFGEYRIVEVAGGTTIFTGNFTIDGAIATNESVDDVAAFSLAETTTGTVQYRIDARRVNGSSPGVVDLYLFARRS